ncbi:MAG: ATP-binding cassette domain-containing protein [Spirochaetia bacterium]
MISMILEARSITKDFPGVRALDNVSLSLQESQIHALCGENGAGKSTFINVLSGYFPSASYSGEILIRGQKKTFSNINEAEAAGIAVIHQELNLFPELSAAENIFMGHEIARSGILDWNEMYSQTKEWLKKLRLDDVLPTTKVKDLGIGKQQLIEIARVLRLPHMKMLILDEPTASLTDSETDLLLDILRELKREGIACIYISHKIDEVMEIADYVTVLRDGKTVGGAEIKDLSRKEIVRMMVGREITEFYPKERHVDMSECVLEVKDYSVTDRLTGKPIVKNAGFRLYRGEVLGLFGLVGAGRTELTSALYGSPPGKVGGEIFIGGTKASFDTPRGALRNGLAYVTEDRKAQGIIPSMNVRENTSIAFLDQFAKFVGIDESREIVEVQSSVSSFQVKTPSLATQIINLSGGNQQKVLLARSLMKKINILILDEPTRGIDVGAKQEIYTIMNSLVASGVSIIMVSSELPEVLGMCDRVLVMCRGEITGEFDNTNKDVTQERIMICATGTGDED